MSRNVEQAYEQGYLDCVRQFKNRFQKLSREFDKAIPIEYVINEVKIMLKEFHAKDK